MAARELSTRIIDPSRVEEVFDDEWITKLAQILPAIADRRRFEESIRFDARTYAEQVRRPTPNEQHAEIARLNRAAENGSFESVAGLLRDLSEVSRASLNARGHRLRSKLALPEPEALLDEATREQACVTVRRLTQYGGAIVEGRMRPSGRRSREYRPVLYAPKPVSRPPRLAAERDFLRNLRLSCLHAVERPPARTANRIMAGPFVRMAEKCFERIGATHVNIPRLINDERRRFKELTGY